MQTADLLIQFGALVVSALALCYLIKYVGYTKTISQHSIRQTEASFKPAIIVIHDNSLEHPPQLRNVGNGTALQVTWRLLNGNHSGVLSYLEAAKDSGPLELPGIRPLFESAIETESPTAIIISKYCSVSGRKYISTSTYDFEAGRFDTAIGEDYPLP